ncbi:aspartate--tRNA ligase, partial [Rhizobium sp. KAs_5_22]
RYFQIVRCFRDEDLRIDRQPEFTQLDMEMSFATNEDVMEIIENLIKKILKDLKNVDIIEPLIRLPYKEAIANYGVDKPDLRYDLLIKDLNEVFANTEIKMLKPLVKQNLSIRGVMIDE